MLFESEIMFDIIPLHGSISKGHDL